MSESNAVFTAATELGIDVNSLDESSNFEAEAIDTEVEVEANEEVVKEETVNDEDVPVSEGEEKEEVPPAEEVKEETPPAAKEVQNIEAERQSLNAEKQAFMEQKAQMEKEFQEKYHEKLKTHDEIDAFFSHLAAKDPDLFDLLKGEFQEHQKQYSNPVIDQVRSQIDSLTKELNAFKAKASDEVTRTKLDAEMNQVKSTLGKEAEAAGLKIDWAKVEDAWADNPKLGLKNAFYAQYGEALVKAAASKAKVEAVEKKVSARPTVATAGNVGRSNAPVSKDFSKMDTRDVVGYFARQIAGKA